MIKLLVENRICALLAILWICRGFGNPYLVRKLFTSSYTTPNKNGCQCGFYGFYLEHGFGKRLLLNIADGKGTYSKH